LERKITYFLYHLPPSLKLLAVLFVSFLLFFWSSFWGVIAAGFGVFALYVFSGFPLIEPWHRLRPLWWLLVALFCVGFFSQGWQQGVLVSLRLGTILLLAAWVTITTPVSQMLATFERGFTLLEPLGANPAKIALVLALTLRFMPVLAQLVAEVREAQQARGLERSLVGIIIPVLIRMLKMGEDVANAIEARSYDS